jgi:hypothetical protein
MTGTVKMTFMASTLREAEELALQQWRVLVGDDEAELEWDTDFQFSTDSARDLVQVVVTVELDDLATVLATAKT